jgi:adenylate kinase
LGAPGSGKGTLAKNLTTDLGYVHLSTGDILRAEIKKESELGKKVKAVLDAGQLVDDNLMQELLKANTDINNNNYIFDGYPRTLSQANFLNDDLLNGQVVTAVFLNLDEQQLVNRLVNRRICSSCGEIYNIVTKNTRKEGVCDNCGGEVVQRKDDKEEVIRDRLTVYNKEISAVIDFYKEKELLKSIDANRDRNTIYTKMKEIVGN